MADSSGSGERTFDPTPRRLNDARRRGEVSHSRDIAPTAALLVTTALVALYAGDAGARLASLMQLSIDSIGQPFTQAAAALAQAAAWTLASITLTVAIPVTLVAVLAEFLHIGPVLSSHPMTPDLSRLDPIAGMKRMFGANGWIELLKSIAKSLLLLGVATVVTAQLMPRIASLHRGTPAAFAEAIRSGTLQLFGWTLATFVVVTILDTLYQRYAFRKRLRMSRSEVERETREDSGDPLIKQHRMGLRRDWAQHSEVAATRSAHMLVVNPTHVAIALDWHPEHVPVPLITAKGEDRIALRMRTIAAEADVPVLRDVPLARALLERGELGEAVPEDLFDAVAQAIVWAQSIRARGEGSAGEDRSDDTDAAPEATAPPKPAPGPLPNGSGSGRPERPRLPRRPPDPRRGPR